MVNDFILAFAGLCTTAIIVGLMCNYAYNLARRTQKEQRAIGGYSSIGIVILGTMTALPSIMLWALLLMSKLGLVNDFMTLYRFLNASFFPFIMLLCPNGTKASELTAFQLTIAFLFSFVPMISFWISYIITYRNIDIKKLLLYDNKSR